MKGFKDSTKTQFTRGTGFAAGGRTKGAAKVATVMREFKEGKLHSGSKKGPKVTNPKQATAIALSEARKAGAKIPAKKMASGGGVYGPTDGGSGSSGGSGGDYRLKDLGSAPSAGKGGNTTVTPSLRGGMPGVKIKSKFNRGGRAAGQMTDAEIEAMLARAEREQGREAAELESLRREERRPKRPLAVPRVKREMIERKGVPSTDLRPLIKPKG